MTFTTLVTTILQYIAIGFIGTVVAVVGYLLIKDKNYLTIWDMIVEMFNELISIRWDNVTDALLDPTVMISIGVGLMLFGALFGGHGGGGAKVSVFGIEAQPIYPTLSNWPGLLVMGIGAFLVFEAAVSLRKANENKGS